MPNDAPLKVTRFAPGDTKTFVPLLCPGYQCENVASLDALFNILQQSSADHPGAHMLATLDDVEQAFYTSGHTIDANDLDANADDDKTLPDFPARLHRLVTAAQAVSLDDIRNRLWWSGEDRLSFFQLQDNPDQILDRTTYIQAVPVRHAWETVAAFPNGYFHGDFNPMENLVLARHLEQTFSYALFGIGASYLAFRRTAPLSADRRQVLANFIIDLHAVSNETDLPAKMRMTLEASDVLILAYIDR